MKSDNFRHRRRCEEGKKQHKEPSEAKDSVIKAERGNHESRVVMTQQCCFSSAAWRTTPASYGTGSVTAE